MATKSLIYSLTVAVLLCFVGHANAKALTRKVQINNVQKPEFLRGFFNTWVRITATDVEDGKKVSFYTPYKTRDQALPEPLKSCRVSYEVGQVKGIVGDAERHINSARIMVSFSCN